MWRSGCLPPQILRDLRCNLQNNSQAVAVLFHYVGFDHCDHIILPPPQGFVTLDSSSDASEEMPDLDALEMVAIEE